MSNVSMLQRVCDAIVNGTTLHPWICELRQYVCNDGCGEQFIAVDVTTRDNSALPPKIGVALSVAELVGAGEDLTAFVLSKIKGLESLHAEVYHSNGEVRAETAQQREAINRIVSGWFASRSSEHFGEG